MTSLSPATSLAKAYVDLAATALSVGYKIGIEVVAAVKPTNVVEIDLGFFQKEDTIDHCAKHLLDQLVAHPRGTVLWIKLYVDQIFTKLPFNLNDVERYAKSIEEKLVERLAHRFDIQIRAIDAKLHRKKDSCIVVEFTPHQTPLPRPA